MIIISLMHNILLYEEKLFHFERGIRKKMQSLIWLVILVINCTSALQLKKENSTSEIAKESSGCFCGIFMDGQLKKGSGGQPKGEAILSQKQSISGPCNSIGNRICLKSCLKTALKYISNGGEILCGSLGRDCFKERAHLFIKNCNDEWNNTNLSREFCCKNGNPYKCFARSELNLDQNSRLGKEPRDPRLMPAESLNLYLDCVSTKKVKKKLISEFFPNNNSKWIFLSFEKKVIFFGIFENIV
ncbi:uncharacterized protein LOC122508039 isoform X2 [Leptopilina heterotoma]|uniref:uncharacterized protein LOC122508039 isoform X2 n=1 Tax=Leptopilina heterotoma TaxID=63436 RepID=UPI001CA7DB48|nr:uncharacterized protein LOC122508039 isoform X2 [Leptopilina heterotoma]